MEQGVAELLTLLKAFIREETLTKTEMQSLDKALPQVLYFAKLHNVMGIWAYKVQEYYAQNSPANEEEQEVLDIAKKIFISTQKRSNERTEKYQRLSQKLRESGIDHLIFKGIVVKEYYPVSELRTFGDIDFVICKEDRERCHLLMEELGYQTILDNDAVYTYRKECEIYEVHTAIMVDSFTERADSVEYFKGFWKHAVLKEEHVWMLSPEFHFVYLVSHIAKHLCESGAGIRMYLDLALYIKCLGESMDWDIVLQELEKLKFTQFLYLVLYGLQHWFGTILPIPVPILEEALFQEFCDFTMESGVFGFEGRSGIEQRVRQQKGLRAKVLIRDFFPSIKALTNRYRYLRKYPWLLPIAWIDRLFRNLRKIGQKAEETKEIITMKKEEIQKNENFYCRIGL